MTSDQFRQAELLLSAYTQGIFPMADSAEDEEFQWIRPEIRAIMPLDHRFHVSKSLQKSYRSGKFQCRLTQDFAKVIKACTGKPSHQGELTCPRDSTWINTSILDTFLLMHQLGYAHSVGVYDQEGTLVGGLYGLAINGVFFGESMFSRMRDASKIALVYLVEILREHNFQLLDCQFITNHLARFGAYEVSNHDYQIMLQQALQHHTKPLLSSKE